MGGIITQERSLGQPPRPVIYSQTGYADRTTYTVPDIHNQSTTSYRSGRRYDVPEDVLAAPDARILYPPRLALKDSRDTGHEFDSTTKRRILHQENGSVSWDVSPGNRILVRGPMVLNLSRYDDVILKEGSFIDIPKISSSELSLWGGRAITGASPTSPSANLSQFAGELLADGLPAWIGVSTLNNRAQAFRSLGGEYLNVEFGWRPFVSDINKLVSSLMTASKQFSQYKRDSGRVVRRRFSFPTDIVTTESSVNHQYGITPVFGFGDVLAPHTGGEPISVSDRVATRYWFSGAFTYHLDVGDDLLNRLSKYEQLGNKLLGTRITPATLWELAPWSWLVDWRATIGTSLSVASAFQEDGLVMKYGYLMRHTVAERTVSARVFGKTEEYKLTVTNAYRTERKERVAATPFGFGLSTDDFTVRQWAILAALGFTRAPRSLR